MPKDKTSIQSSITYNILKSNSKDKEVYNVFKVFLKLGLTSFGGPVAHLAYFRKEFVEQRKWVSDNQFSQLLAICQFLPGPVSSQLGFTLGLLRSGLAGAIAAFLAFTLPSAIFLAIFASALPFFSGNLSAAVISGLKIVAFAVVADAILSMSKKLCPDTTRRSIAILSGSVLILMDSAWTQIFVIISGAISGYFFCNEHAIENKDLIQVTYSRRVSLILLLIFSFLLLICTLPLEFNNSFPIFSIFYRAGSLVFGGGHVVLPLLENSVVTPGFMTKETFLAGYGAAQAIPGPMFAFSAYLGAMIPSEHGSLFNIIFALIFTFLPGFLLVTSILPIWERMSKNEIMINSISGINAAVVGLLGAALYKPIFLSGINSNFDLAIGLLAFSMLAVWKLSPLLIVVFCIITTLFQYYSPYI